MIGTYGYLQNLKYEGEMRRRQEAEDRRRTQAMEDKQMALLDAEIANLQKGTEGTGNEAVRSAAQEAANKYLGKWNESLQKAEGMFSGALARVDEAGQLIDRAYENIGDIDKVAEDVTSEWTQFKSDFAPIQEQLVGGASEAIGMRSQLRRSMMDLTRPDYEGAAGRAMADVAGASERGRKAEAMRLSGLGIDPASGRGRAAMVESRNTEALNSAMAGNAARLAEKDRIAGLTAQGLQLIDPNADISAATQIQNLSSNLLAQRSNMATTKAGLQTTLAGAKGNLATTSANIASSQARDVAGQYGDYGAAQQGIAYANTPTPGTPGAANPNTVSGYAASIGVTGFEGQDQELTSNLRSHLDMVKKGQTTRASYGY